MSRLKILKIEILFIGMIICAPSILYAQDESSKQPNNKQKNSVTNELIRVNKAVSSELGKAADKIDKNIAPRATGEIEKNKTQIFVILGGDFADNGDIEGNFRYGGQLHLPRFEKYWKVKFANQDEKRERGQSNMTREQRARDDNEDFFLGLNFARRWEGIDVDYKPQIAFTDGVGLDHSIEAQTNFEFGQFIIEPNLELFANHDEGLGSSSALNFRYLFTPMFSIGQFNDTRYVYLDHDLLTNHSIGLGYTVNDKLGLGTSYFRSFANSAVGGYMITAYGYYLTVNYKIYQEMLLAEVKPYIVYERAENFEQTNGIVLNFRVNF